MWDGGASSPQADTNSTADNVANRVIFRCPISFLVDIETSEGTFTVKMRRHWSPLGVDRVYHLMDNDYYAGARIYRMVAGFVAQWGYSGEPVRDSIWRDLPIDDEPVVASNGRGFLSFARR